MLDAVKPDVELIETTLPVPRADHQSERRLHREEDAFEVDREDTVVLGLARVEDAAEHPEAGVADDRGERRLRVHLAEDAMDLLDVRDVERDGGDTVAVRLEIRGRVRRPLEVDVRDRDPVAALRERLDDGEADPARATGDQCRALRRARGAHMNGEPTGTMWPVTPDARSLARKRTARATSSGVARRWSGVASPSAARASSTVRPPASSRAWSRAT